MVLVETPILCRRRSTALKLKPRFTCSTRSNVLAVSSPISLSYEPRPVFCDVGTLGTWEKRGTRLAAPRFSFARAVGRFVNVAMWQDCNCHLADPQVRGVEMNARLSLLCVPLRRVGCEFGSLDGRAAIT